MNALKHTPTGCIDLVVHHRQHRKASTVMTNRRLSLTSSFVYLCIITRLAWIPRATDCRRRTATRSFSRTSLQTDQTSLSTRAFLAPPILTRISPASLARPTACSKKRCWTTRHETPSNRLSGRTGEVTASRRIEITRAARVHERRWGERAAWIRQITPRWKKRSRSDPNAKAHYSSKRGL